MKPRFLVDFLAFQVVWFACVMSATVSLPSLVLLLLATFISVGRAKLDDIRPNLANGMACLGLGMIGDNLLAHLGVIHFQPSDTLLPAPVWILCLWFCFGLWLKLLFGWFTSTYTKALVGFSLGGAAAYWAGERLGSLSLPPEKHALVWVGLEWAAAGLVLCRLSRISLFQDSQDEPA